MTTLSGEEPVWPMSWRSSCVVPPAALLDVVTYADLTTSPDGAAVTVAQRLSEILARYAEDSAVHRAVVESSPLLLAAADRVEERLALSGA